MVFEWFHKKELPISPEELDSTLRDSSTYQKSETLKNLLRRFHIEYPYQVKVDVNRLPHSFWHKSDFRKVRVFDESTKAATPELFFKIRVLEPYKNGNSKFGSTEECSLEDQYRHLLHLHSCKLPVPEPFGAVRLPVKDKELIALVTKFWEGQSLDSYFIAVDSRIEEIEKYFKDVASGSDTMKKQSKAELTKESNVYRHLRTLMITHSLRAMVEIGVYGTFWDINPNKESTHLSSKPPTLFDYTEKKNLQDRLKSYFRDIFLYLAFKNKKVDESGILNVKGINQLPSKLNAESQEFFSDLEKIVDCLVEPLTGTGLYCLWDSGPHNITLRGFENVGIKAGFYDTGDVGKGLIEADIARFLVSPIINLPYSEVNAVYGDIIQYLTQFINTVKRGKDFASFDKIESLDKFVPRSLLDFNKIAIYKLIKNLSHIARGRLGDETTFNNLCTEGYSFPTTILQQLAEENQLEIPENLKKDKAINRVRYSPTIAFPLLQDNLRLRLEAMLDEKDKEFVTARDQISYIKKTLEKYEIILPTFKSA